MINPCVYGKKILDTFLNTHNHKSMYVENAPGAVTQYLGKIDPNKRNRVSFKSDVYIGLLNKMPQYDETTSSFTGWQEPEADEYRRFKLTKTSPTLPDNTPILKSDITEQPIKVQTTVTVMENGESKDIIVTDEVIAAYIVNQDNIVFPRVETKESASQWNGDSGIVGFALFSSDEKTEQPFMWGDIQPVDGGAEAIILEEDQIPIIRPNGFKITMT